MVKALNFQSSDRTTDRGSFKWSDQSCTHSFRRFCWRNSEARCSGVYRYGKFENVGVFLQEFYVEDNAKSFGIILKCTNMENTRNEYVGVFPKEFYIENNAN